MKLIIIGLGGIGSHLAGPLCRFWDSMAQSGTIRLIDGDSFESKNSERQHFLGFGNKAEVIAEELRERFPKLEIEAKPCYMTEMNIFAYIGEEDIVFSCVDNHATRKIISDRCRQLRNVTLISGGNNYDDGNVQVNIRKNGEDVTKPITYLHPEIEEPKDKNPAEMGCEELAQSGSPQLICANLMAASWMLSTFWKMLEWRKEGNGKPFSYSESYFDLKTGNARSSLR